ncbi:hypothetical protein DID96_33665 [Burkholderia sp. Bp8963]|nr:hypothetical protein DID96_33665 [Burkholderia sp. Bp8963]
MQILEYLFIRMTDNEAPSGGNMLRRNDNVDMRLHAIPVGIQIVDDINAMNRSRDLQRGFIAGIEYDHRPHDSDTKAQLHAFKIGRHRKVEHIPVKIQRARGTGGNGWNQDIKYFHELKYYAVLD